MIDRRFEQFLERQLPRVRLRLRGYDPDCKACRTEAHTEGKYTGLHSCAQWAGKIAITMPKMRARA